MMTRAIYKFGKTLMVRFAALATVALSVTGCTYDIGLGFASDGYGSGYYECDPYSPFDSYYDCDNSYGFYNIGFGGGWYENYWYPGHGFYLFDNYGRRYPMRDNDRRYWGERRHNWYRENRRRNRDGGRYDGRGHGYTGSAAPNAKGWPERNGGRVRDGDVNRRDSSEGRRDQNRDWQGGRGTSVAPVLRTESRAAGHGDGGRRGFRAPPQPAPEANGQYAAPRAVPAPPLERAERGTVARQSRSGVERVEEQ